VDDSVRLVYITSIWLASIPSPCPVDWFSVYIFHRKSLKTFPQEFECLYRRRRVNCRTDCPSPSNPRPQL